jgi:hypothetical protein
MPETLDNLAKVNEPSKSPETLQTDRSGRCNENPSAQIIKTLARSLDLVALQMMVRPPLGKMPHSQYKSILHRKTLENHQE